MSGWNFSRAKIWGGGEMQEVQGEIEEDKAMKGKDTEGKQNAFKDKLMRAQGLCVPASNNCPSTVFQGHCKGTEKCKSNQG